MRAVVQSGYGPPAEVLAVGELDPPAPAEDEVLVRVGASSVHPDVWHVIVGRPYIMRLMGSGLRRPAPVVPGTELAGTVEAVGRGVTRFAVGDEVFGESLRGIQWRNGGTWAELATAPEEGLAPRPAGLGVEPAACVATAGLIVLQNLARVGELAGRRTLVNGAAGGVGGMAVQILAAMGAEVVGVDAGPKLDLVRSLGADAVVDYESEDPTRRDERFDLVFDIPGNQPLSAWERVLAPEGRYVLIGHDGFGATAGPVIGSMRKMLPLMARAPLSKHLATDFKTQDKAEAMARLAAWCADGAVAPVVERSYGLDGAAAAMERLSAGDATGRLVLVP